MIYFFIFSQVVIKFTYFYLLILFFKIINELKKFFDLAQVHHQIILQILEISNQSWAQIQHIFQNSCIETWIGAEVEQNFQTVGLQLLQFLLFSFENVYESLTKVEFFCDQSLHIRTETVQHYIGEIEPEKPKKSAQIWLFDHSTWFWTLTQFDQKSNQSKFTSKW